MTTISNEIALNDHARVVYIPDFLDPHTSESLFELFLNTLHWEQSTITLFGKQHLIPRLNAWYGEMPYKYSGTEFKQRDFTAELQTLLLKIQQQSNITLNSVLANLYRSGSDCMGWHRDNEKSLGPQPQIASLSLGETRRFVLRSRVDHQKKQVLELGNGSLLLMLGDTQKDWEHSLPRTRKPVGPRINLTFRQSY